MNKVNQIMLSSSLQVSDKCIFINNWYNLITNEYFNKTKQRTNVNADSCEGLDDIPRGSPFDTINDSEKNYSY